MTIHDNYNQHQIEKAIAFLVGAITTSGHNPKPVILHSIRTALYLYEKQYPERLIIGTLLHDILEDSDVTSEQIKTEFGEEIEQLVLALSFDSEIEDKWERFKKNLDNLFNYGKDALIVKAADIIDNSDFFDPKYGQDVYEYVMKKMDHFINTTEEYLIDEPLWDDLLKKYKQASSRGNFTH